MEKKAPTSTIVVAPLERFTFKSRVFGTTKDWKDRAWWQMLPTATVRLTKVGELTSIWFDKLLYGEDLPEFMNDQHDLRRTEWLAFEDKLPERFRPRKMTRIPVTFAGFVGDVSVKNGTWLVIFPDGTIETQHSPRGWFQLPNRPGGEAGYFEAEAAYTTFCDDKPENTQIEKLDERVAQLEKLLQEQTLLAQEQTRKIENLTIALGTLLPRTAISAGTPAARMDTGL